MTIWFWKDFVVEWETKKVIEGRGKTFDEIIADCIDSKDEDGNFRMDLTRRNQLKQKHKDRIKKN